MIEQKNIKVVTSVPFEFGIVKLRSDNIITIEPKEGINSYTLPHVKAIHQIALELVDGKPKPCFFENSKYKKNVDNEVNVYTRKHLHEFASACAMTENSPLTRFFIHSYLYMFGSPIPIKMFKTKEECINWLQKLEK